MKREKKRRCKEKKTREIEGFRKPISVSMGKKRTAAKPLVWELTVGGMDPEQIV